MLPGFWVESEERKKLFHMSATIFYAGITMVIPSDKVIDSHSTNWFIPHSAIAVFSPSLWCVLLVVLAAFLGRHVIVPVYTCAAGHHCCCPQRRTVAMRLTVLFTGLFSIHSLTLYQNGLLTTLFQNDRYKPAINDLDDVVNLLKSGTAIIDLRNPSFIYTKLLITKDMKYDGFDKLREAIRGRYYYSAIEKEPEGPRTIIRLFGDISVMTLFEKEDCNRFIVPIPHTEKQSVAWLLNPRVNQSNVDCINEAIEDSRPVVHDVIYRNMETNRRDFDRCRELKFEESTKMAGEPIRLIRLSGILVLLGLGCLFAVVVFCVEKIINMFCL